MPQHGGMDLGVCGAASMTSLLNTFDHSAGPDIPWPIALRTASEYGQEMEPLYGDMLLARHVVDEAIQEQGAL
jgi:hypothetical protein